MHFRSFVVSCLLSTFAVFLPIVVSAHVTIEPRNALAGSYAKLTFRVSHGCDGSPTKQITVKLPEGVLSVKPQVHTGWNITTKKVKLVKPASLHGKEITESVSEVTWSGGLLSDEFMDEFAISMKLPESASGPLAFPVIQECKKGTLQWTEIAKDDKSHSDFPAPLLILEVKSAAEHEHSH
jgi:uncharacterized protein YcnI